MTKVSNKIKRIIEPSNKNKPIDIVIPWVNEKDLNWQENRNKYMKNIDNEGTNIARFRDWGTFKYVFRSIEQNMPWVNKIYVITCGQKPDFLNLENKKIVLIDHKDFIPEKYLPTFSSHTIELNLHRIKDLSENFVYFNDDIYAISKIEPSFFFIKDLPCDTAVLNTHCGKKSKIIYNIAFNDTAFINDYFDIKKVLKENKNKWFNYRYGVKNNLQNVIFSVCPRFPGFKQFHSANAFNKQSFQNVWNLDSNCLNETCLNKFREKNGVNQWLIREYQLVTGKFFPSNKYKKTIMIDFEKMGINNAINICKKEINNKKYKLMCINDGDDIPIDKFNYIQKSLISILQKKFPNKSNFEK